MLLQGFLFAFVGMCAGLTGTAISNGLLLSRQKLDPNFKSQNEAPNVPLNAATWAAHMGISSNVRYQVLNGLDMVSLNINMVQYKTQVGVRLQCGYFQANIQC